MNDHEHETSQMGYNGWDKKEHTDKGLIKELEVLLKRYKRVLYVLPDGTFEIKGIK